MYDVIKYSFNKAIMNFLGFPGGSVVKKKKKKKERKKRNPPTNAKDTGD